MLFTFNCLFTLRAICSYLLIFSATSLNFQWFVFKRFCMHLSKYDSIGIWLVYWIFSHTLLTELTRIASWVSLLLQAHEMYWIFFSFSRSELDVRPGNLHIPDGSHYPRFRPYGHNQQLSHQFWQRSGHSLQWQGCPGKSPRLGIFSVSLGLGLTPSLWVTSEGSQRYSQRKPKLHKSHE